MAAKQALIARSNAHTHTQFCDGKSTAEEVVQAALARGFVSLGFSSHAKQDFHPEYSLNPQREALYIAEISRLQAACEGQLAIWLGMERDRFSYADRAPFAYVIGAVHYVRTPEGAALPVDASAQLLEEAIGFDYRGDGQKLAEDYFESLGAYIREYKPDIIAHFDLLTKYNPDGRFFDTSHPRYIKAATDAMDAAITGCRLLEINVGGIIRARTTEPYPSLPLLRYWHALGGQVTLTSDCHNTAQLDSGFDQGIAHIRAAGYQKAAILGRRESLFEWVDVPG